jgi:hypothetical protein
MTRRKERCVRITRYQLNLAASVARPLHLCALRPAASVVECIWQYIGVEHPITLT